jgi:hypothetical protein
MNKYAESIYNRQDIQEALKISIWEKFCLLFVKSKEVRTEESISHYKNFRGKFFLLDFKMTK